MNARRMPVGLMLMVPVLGGLAIYAVSAQGEVLDPNATPTAEARATEAPGGSPTLEPTEAPSADYLTATAGDGYPLQTPEPTPVRPVAQRGDFREGAWVRVNAGTGDCLNARNQASMSVEYVIVQTCLPDGFEGMLTGQAQFGDGRWWWYMAGMGYVAEEYLVFVRMVDLEQARSPELADRGKIAFFRSNQESDGTYSYAIWLMNADGSDQRMIYELDAEKYPQAMRWSPDGSVLTFNTGRSIPGGNVYYTDPGLNYGPDRYGSDVHVLRFAPDGSVAETVFEDAFGGGFTPDSAKMAIIHQPHNEGMSLYRIGVPAVLDLHTGGRLVLTSTPMHIDDQAFNYDGTLMMFGMHPFSQSGWDDGTRAAIVVWDTDGNEVHHIEQNENEWYGDPLWSPVDNRIAFHHSNGNSPSYDIYDLAQGRVIGSARVPKASDKIGGKCGGADMWRSAWSLDGSHLLYSFDSGDTGANGIWSYDVATGAQALVPASASSSPVAGPDGLLAFSSGDHIFIGHEAGGFPRIVARGTNPAWWPGAVNAGGQ